MSRIAPEPKKTKIVYCKDDNRDGSYPVQQFDFLGFNFRARRIKNRDGEMQWLLGFIWAVGVATERSQSEAPRRSLKRAA